MRRVQFTQNNSNTIITRKTTTMN